METMQLKHTQVFTVSTSFSDSHIFLLLLRHLGMQLRHPFGKESNSFQVIELNLIVITWQTVKSAHLENDKLIKK